MASTTKTIPFHVPPQVPQKPQVPPKTEFSSEEAALAVLLRSEDTEQAIRASAFLLDWASIAGSKEVPGFLVLGIAQTLNLLADRMKGDCE